MPNLHVTDRQVMLYMTRSQQHDQESAAAMAGFSARTARRIDKDPRLPSQKRQPRTWRTRTDPLTDVWPRVLEMLKIPGMMAVTIFEDLQDEVGPEVFPDRVRRTLERRIARWRALHGEDKEVYFPQRHDPGRQALSDFTVTDSLGVTIAGEPFPHRLYHFRLACSGWEHVRVILGGEFVVSPSRRMCRIDPWQYGAYNLMLLAPQSISRLPVSKDAPPQLAASRSRCRRKPATKGTKTLACQFGRKQLNHRLCTAAVEGRSNARQLFDHFVGDDADHDEPLPAGADHPSSPRGKRSRPSAQPVGVATAHRREAAR